MATCPRCGQLNRPGTVACAACGAFLAPTANSPMPAGDDGLPGWLRQLQSGQLHGAPQTYQNGGGFAAPAQQPREFGGTPQQFSAGSLVSDDALPEWLLGANPAPMPQAPQAPASWNPGGGPAAEEWSRAPSPYAQPYGVPSTQEQGMGYGSAQPAPPTSGPLGYTQPASALFDESALPDWLREASRGQGIDPRPQPPFVQPPAPAPGPSSAFPSIEHVGMNQPEPPNATGLSGRALLETGALPQWLGGHPGAAAPAARVSNPGGMSAQSLIDESALPQWLRAQPNAGTGTIPAPAAPTPFAQSPSVSNRIASSAAAEPLPAWLNQVYADANVARVETPPAPAPWGAAPGIPAPPPSAPFAPGQPVTQGTGGMSAGEFIDESALPEWLRSQGAMDAPDALAGAASGGPFASPYGAGQPENRIAPQYMPSADTWDGSAGAAMSGRLAPELPPTAGGQFAASDLIDPAALPSWVKGEADAPPSFSSTSGWTSRQAAAPMSAPGPSSTLDAQQPAVSQSLGWGSMEPEWDAGWDDRPLSDPMTSQAGAFRDERDPRFSGVLEFDDNDGMNEYQAGPRRPRRDVPAAQAGRGPDPRFGQRAPNTDRRRGPPIPQHELPPWLQHGGPAQGMQGGPGRGPMVQGNYPMGPSGGYEGGEWGGMAPDDEQWANWDDGQYDDGAGYGGAYPGYPPPGAGPSQRRSGWRRFFGRR